MAEETGMPANEKSKKTIVYENLKRRFSTNALKPGDPPNEGVLSKERLSLKYIFGQLFPTIRRDSEREST
jgi:hypothetical protein